MNLDSAEFLPKAGAKYSGVSSTFRLVRSIERLSQLVISISWDNGKKCFSMTQDRPLLLLASEGFTQCIIGHSHVKSSEYPSYMYSSIL